MKIAAAFLLSMTVFTSGSLDSSSAQEVDSDQIEPVRQYVVATYKNINKLLADTISNVEGMVNKATGDEKKTLTKVDKWLKSLKGVSKRTEDKLAQGLSVGTAEAIQDTVDSHRKSIQESRTELDQSIQLLDENPGKVTDSVKTVIKKTMDTVLQRATSNLDSVKQLISVGQNKAT